MKNLNTITKSNFLSMIKDPGLKKFAEDLWAAGFDLIYHGQTPTRKLGLKYFSFHYNNRIGYVQLADLGGGYHLASSYKPSRKHGSGRSYKRNTPELTVQDAKRATLAGLIVPNYGKGPQPYESLEKYMTAPAMTWRIKHAQVCPGKKIPVTC